MRDVAEPMTPEREAELLDAWVRNVKLRDFLPPGFPTIVTLCGSTRFKEEYEQAMAAEADAGKIVLSVSRFGHVHRQTLLVDGCMGPQEVVVDVVRDDLSVSDERKKKLDELHLRKIDLADEILVINPEVIVCGFCGKPARLYTELSGETECCRTRRWHRDKYVGESTRREIAYAEKTGKKVRYLY